MRTANEDVVCRASPRDARGGCSDRLRRRRRGSGNRAALPRCRRNGGKAWCRRAATAERRSQLGRDFELAQELFVGRRGRRHMIPAELRRARGRGDQDTRQRSPRRRSSRASSNATTAPMLWPKNAKGRSCMARWRAPAPPRAAPCARTAPRRGGIPGPAVGPGCNRQTDVRSSSRVREPEEPRRRDGVDAGKPGRGGGPFAETQRQQSALLVRELRASLTVARPVAARIAGFIEARSQAESLRRGRRSDRAHTRAPPPAIAARSLRSARDRSAACRAPRAMAPMSCGGTSATGTICSSTAGWYFTIGSHRQQVRNAHLRLGNPADIGGHHRHAAQHRFEHDARPRFGPQRRNQQDARPLQQIVDIVDRVEQANVRRAPAARRGRARSCPMPARRRTRVCGNASASARKIRCLSPRTDSPS